MYVKSMRNIIALKSRFISMLPLSRLVVRMIMFTKLLIIRPISLFCLFNCQYSNVCQKDGIFTYTFNILVVVYSWTEFNTRQNCNDLFNLDHPKLGLV